MIKWSILFGLLLITSIAEGYVGAKCTRSSQCGIGEMCLIDQPNTFEGKCVKIK